MPTITVMERFLVHKAIIRVGIRANKTGQSIKRNAFPSIKTLSIIKAVNRQTGIKESHLLTSLGIVIFLTIINGSTRGIKVTIAQAKIIKKIV